LEVVVKQPVSFDALLGLDWAADKLFSISVDVLAVVAKDVEGLSLEQHFLSVVEKEGNVQFQIVKN
jgi:hypothetical protein